ncbi:MAG: thioredoxin family protein [Bacteroidales bacterium]|nr:thioredoxin family protein [Bacteroidales bacterium]MDD4821504.1 thioredoxin family protein [Bacteroidales bacterium]
MEIKVLATKGCANCHAFYEAVLKAVAELQLDATVTKVDDIIGILSYGLSRIPGLVVDGKIIHYGSYLSLKEIKELLKKQTSSSDGLD